MTVFFQWRALDFGLAKPVSCAGVPSEILDPRNTWSDKSAYDMKAQKLADAFNKNFDKFKSSANQEILSAAPKGIKSLA